VHWKESKRQNPNKGCSSISLLTGNVIETSEFISVYGLGSIHYSASLVWLITGYNWWLLHHVTILMQLAVYCVGKSLSCFLSLYSLLVLRVSL